MLIEFYTVDGVRKDAYTVAAPAGGDPLFVNGNDVLNGTAGADYLWGLNGNDTLKGLAGHDMLIGGAGDDLFVFAAGNGQDTVADFVPGAGTADRLDLRAFGIDMASEFGASGPLRPAIAFGDPPAARRHLVVRATGAPATSASSRRIVTSTTSPGRSSVSPVATKLLSPSSDFRKMVIRLRCEASLEVIGGKVF